jgi:uncharacterized protein
MRVIDSHMHFFSSAYFDTLAARSPLVGTAAEKLANLVQRTRIELPSASASEHAARWKGELERHGVDHAALFASVPEELDAVMEAQASAPERLSAIALLDPRDGPAVARFADLLGTRAVRGALCFPALHRAPIDGPDAAPMLRALQQHGGVVYVHCGIFVAKLRDLLGFPRTQDIALSNPLRIASVASAYPAINFVIPHFGAGFFRETLIVGAQCPNVHVDTSSSNAWMATLLPKPKLSDVLERALEVFGPERILFGTDSGVFPAGWKRERYDEQRVALAAAGATRAGQELVFAGNARRLLRLT